MKIIGKTRSVRQFREMLRDGTPKQVAREFIRERPLLRQSVMASLGLVESGPIFSTAANARSTL
jgi:hypothetical protein